MPRIRTIKPEFWTSAQVLECSRNARLLFIGLWNFADDAGRHPDNPKQCKAEIFPADELSVDDVRGMIDELSMNSLVLRYVVDGKALLQITGWRHQRIDKPQLPKYPEPLPEHSQNDLGALPPEGIGYDTIVEEDSPNGELSTEVDPTPKTNGSHPTGIALAKQMADVWTEILGDTLASPRSFPSSRVTVLGARWRGEFGRDESNWRAFCERIRGSPFLCGDNDRGWRADIDWACKPSNVAKVLEGRYDGDGTTSDRRRLEEIDRVLTQR